MQTDSEFLKDLRKRERLSQQELANKLTNVSRSYIGQIENNQSPLSPRVRTEIEEKFLKKETNDIIKIPYYYNVSGSCGTGVFEQSQDFKPLTVSKELINNYSKNKAYSIINALGDSMLPFIHNNDLLIVEQYNGEQIKDNNIYVFIYNNEIFIKRLVKNIDEIIIISDNEAEIYRPRIIEKENINDIHILGKIVGIYRHCN